MHKCRASSRKTCLWFVSCLYSYGAECTALPTRKDAQASGQPSVLWHDLLPLWSLQSVMGNNQTLNQMLGGATPQNPLANLATNPPNPWPTLGHSLTQRDSLPTGVGPSLMSPHGIPPELQQQALQKLQQQQGADQGGLHRGMSGDLSMQPGSSRQSSATMQHNFQLPSLPAQASQLNPKQLMLLQQHMQVTFCLRPCNRHSAQLYIPAMPCLLFCTNHNSTSSIALEPSC